jgi:hypothetical protein
MRMPTTWIVAALLTAAVLGGLTSSVVAQKKKADTGSRMEASFSPSELAGRTLHRRAVEAVI